MGVWLPRSFAPTWGFIQPLFLFPLSCCLVEGAWPSSTSNQLQFLRTARTTHPLVRSHSLIILSVYISWKRGLGGWAFLLDKGTKLLRGWSRDPEVKVEPPTFTWSFVYSTIGDGVPLLNSHPLWTSIVWIYYANNHTPPGSAPGWLPKPVRILNAQTEYAAWALNFMLSSHSRAHESGPHVLHV